MFIYYVNSLHQHHEQTLLLSKKTSDAYLAIWAHMVDGQFKMAMSLLNPVTVQLANHQPVAAWEMLPDAENQKHLAMHWFDENKAKMVELQHVLFATIEHQTTGWNVIANELLTKLQTDSAPQFRELLSLSKQSVQQVAETEKAAIHAVEALSAPTEKKAPKRRAPANKAGAIK